MNSQHHMHEKARGPHQEVVLCYLGPQETFVFLPRFMKAVGQ